MEKGGVMAVKKLEQNRMFIDLIHGKKFNESQRQSVKKAIDAGLNIVQLKMIAKEEFSSEHIDAFVKFMKSGTYKDNKKLFSYFTNPSIEVGILTQINKALEDKMIESEILKFAQPNIYTPDQMNELRVFLKKGQYTDEYYQFIFDQDKNADTMKAIREVCNMEIPFDEINGFDCYSVLYPTMLEAVMNGILPQEVNMILEVTDDKKKFDAIIHGISIGLDDEEIQTCLSGDERHLEFYLRLMGEIHDNKFLDKITKIKEVPRRDLIECFSNEDTFFKYLLHIHERNQMDKESQIDCFFSDCGKLDEVKLLTNKNYLNNFIQEATSDKNKLSKLALKAFLLEEFATTYEVENYYPDRVSLSSVIEDVSIHRYGELVENREYMNYFLSHYNGVMDMLQEKIDTIKKEEGYISFELCKDFEVVLKEFKDYYDVDKVIIRYSDSRVCEIPNKTLEKLASDIRKVRVNDHANIPKRFEMKEREI